MSNTLETTICLFNIRFAKVLLAELVKMEKQTDVVICDMMAKYNCFTTTERMVWQIDGYSDIKGREMIHSKFQ